MTAAAMKETVELIQLNLEIANAINQPFLDYLNQRLDDLERSKATAAVLTGYEGFFSAGLDSGRTV